jgi:hypothetical protein
MQLDQPNSFDPREKFLVSGENHEAPYYEVSSGLPSPRQSYVQITSSASCSQTSSACIRSSLRGISFHQFQRTFNIKIICHNFRC